MLAARLIEGGSSEEALEVLKVAQELDPTNLLLRDQTALASQKDSDRRTVDMKERLRHMKEDIGLALEKDDQAHVLEQLQTIDRMPLTWDAVHETAIGKEVGKCAKHDNPDIADCAKAIIATLHKLAKQQRPMWVR
uniref:TFIIS N-terminal domain-containing protein n=1 Tax=Alexandrium andersonii TaxID=327968 RepID=A0A7S2AGP9_9DINO